MIGDPGRVLKKQVSGFDLKKPGYPGRVSGFEKYIKLAISCLKNRQIGAFWSKNSQISLKITKLALFGPQNGDQHMYNFLNDFWLITVKMN